ncbi:hypothetical protein HYDPIDRAFT_29060 [Hydnomerulius pinastri MD-312]|uniref:Uncharacterized protein n=1 Tax=Hydnomerulius pinastri MD-312 TaxID=994086 RepID=A0A0C9VZ85_9AGAM|nr:hypothetical protein HYDPIDRAFT_29060 [Hydnomerulius pinastri MD-312]
MGGSTTQKEEEPEEQILAVEEDYAMDVDEEDFYGYGEVENLFKGARCTYGQAATFMDVFDSDEFAKERKENLFYPFSNHYNWQVRQWLLGSGLSMAAIDKFLSLHLMHLKSYPENQSP